MNKKKVLFLLLLLITLAGGFVQADETEVTSQGSVGFTGIWEAPQPSTDKISEPSPPTESSKSVSRTPQNATSFPATGEEVLTSVISSLIGGVLLLLVMAHEKMRRNKKYRNDKKQTVLSSTPFEN